MEEDLDVVGYWSELKLSIIRDYAWRYTTILTNTDYGLLPIYIDGFAGAGEHKSAKTGELIPGSPKQALEVKPPFHRLYFIDQSELRVRTLQKID